MKDELGGKIMKEFDRLGTKTYSYLTDHDNEGKKAKGTKSVSQSENLVLKILNIDWKQCNLRTKVFI